MTKEALKLALEALERLALPKNADDIFRRAVIAIKEALAQPEQERFLVATIGNWGRVEWADGVFPSLGDKMYSAPRTWVGLTNDEIFEIHKQVDSMQYLTFGHAIEAKLKEKNT